MFCAEKVKPFANSHLIIHGAQLVWRAFVTAFAQELVKLCEKCAVVRQGGGTSLIAASFGWKP